jgi:hypothetical protein
VTLELMVLDTSAAHPAALEESQWHAMPAPVTS